MSRPQRDPDPTEDEIREGTRVIREKGFFYGGDFFPAWQDERYYHRAMNDKEQRVEFEFPDGSFIEEKPINIEEEWFPSYFDDVHTLDSGPEIG